MMHTSSSLFFYTETDKHVYVAVHILKFIKNTYVSVNLNICYCVT